MVSSPPDRVALIAARAAILLEEIKVHYPGRACATLPRDCRRQLQALISDYAAALRERGEGPDQTVKHTRFLIARTMREVDLFPGCLMDAAVAWAMDGYYQNPRPRRSSSRQHLCDVDADAGENRMGESLPLSQAPDKEIPIRDL